MKIKTKWFILVLVIAAESAFTTGESYFSVIGPEMTQLSGHYTFVIANNNNNPMNLKVSFCGKISGKVYKTKPNMQEPITMNVTDDKKIDSCLLVISDVDSNQKINKTIKIFNQKNTVFIQTDKTHYKPGEKFKYRIIALNADMIPLNFKKLILTISPANSQETKITKDYSFEQNGVYTGYMMFSDNTYYGDWEFQVSIDNDTAIVAKRTITVDKSRSSHFDVMVVALNEIITKDDLKKIEFEVKARYAEGPENYSIEGNVVDVKVLILNHEKKLVHADDSPKIQKNKLTSIIDLEKLKGRMNLTSAYFVKILVKYEDYTGEQSEGECIIEVRSSKESYIEFTTNESYFTPGKKYKIKLLKKLFDGTLDTNPKKIRASLMIRNSVTTNGTDVTRTFQEHINVEFSNGVYENELETDQHDISMLLSLELGKQIFNKKILRIPSRSQEYLSIETNPIIDKAIEGKVYYSGKVGRIYFVVLGRSGVLKQGEVKEDWILPPIEVTKEMKPECTLIVYHLREDGEVIFNQKKIYFEKIFPYDVTVHFDKSNPHPEETLKITIQSKPYAFIALMAVRENSNIPESDYINDHNVKEAQSKNFVRKNITSIDLAINAVNLFKESNSFIDTSIQTKYSTKWNRSKRSIVDSEMKDSKFIDDSEDEFDENISRKKITLYHDEKQPDTWLFEDFTTDENGKYIFETKLPGKIASYTVRVISVHPNHGMSISKPLKISTANNFYVEVNMPKVIFEKDTIKAEFVVRNFKNSSMTVYIRLNVDSNEFQFLKEVRKENSCKVTNTSRENIKVRLPPNSVQKGHFQLFSLKASASSTLNILSSTDETFENYFKSSKSITVLNKDETRGEMKAKLFDLREHRFSSFYFTFDTPKSEAHTGATSVSGLVAGNIIGPSMTVENLKNFILEYKFTDKISTFERAGEILKYLQAVNSTRTEVMKKLEELVTYGYFYVLTTRKNQTMDKGSFMEHENAKVGSLIATAKVVKILNLVKPWNYGSNDNFIVDGLTYLKKMQKPEGHWESDEVRRPDIKDDLDRKVFLTAYIVVALLENAPYKERYSDCIDQGLNYIRKNYEQVRDQHTLAIAAYAMAFESFEDCEILLRKLNVFSVRNDETKLEGWNYNEHVEVEIAAYVILAYEKMNRPEKSKDALEFLLNNRKEGGGFSTIENTNLGIKALSAISKHLHTEFTKIVINLDNGDENKKQRFFVKNETPEQKFSFQGDEGISAGLEGNGVAYIQCYQNYKVKNRTFTSNDYIVNAYPGESELEVCITQTSYSGAHLIVIQIPSGYLYKNIGRNGNVEALRFDDHTSKLSIVTKKISKNEKICFKIAMIKIFKVNSMAFLPITVEKIGDSRGKGMIYYMMNSRDIRSCID